MSNDSSKNANDNTSQAEEHPEGCEYGCRYCKKKFTNKQALGGHQNAHKIERSIEKNAREVQKNQLGYFAGHSSYPTVISPYSSGSFYRSQEFVNRALINSPYHSHYTPYPRPGFNPPAHYEWNAPVTRISQFATPTLNAHYGDLNTRFPTIGSGGSNVRPVLENIPYVNDSRVVPRGNLGGQNNNQVNNPENQQVEDSDLDLTLSL